MHPPAMRESAAFRQQTNEGRDCRGDPFDRFVARRDLVDVDVSCLLRPHREYDKSEADERPAAQTAVAYVWSHHRIVISRPQFGQIPNGAAWARERHSGIPGENGFLRDRITRPQGVAAPAGRAGRLRTLSAGRWRKRMRDLTAR